MLPWFLIAFIAIAGAGSVDIILKAVTECLNEASRWRLATAIATLGMKTLHAAPGKAGWRPAAFMMAEAVLPAGIVVVLVVVAIPQISRCNGRIPFPLRCRLLFPDHAPPREISY